MLGCLVRFWLHIKLAIDVFFSEEDEAEEEASSADPPNSSEEETNTVDEDAVKESSETESAGPISRSHIDSPL